MNTDTDSLRAAKEMLADPDAYFTRQRAIREQEAKDYVATRLANRAAQRPPLRITWAPILALVASLVLASLFGYELGSWI